jgi:hypothetical protein
LPDLVVSQTITAMAWTMCGSLPNIVSPLKRLAELLWRAVVEILRDAWVAPWGDFVALHSWP